MELGTIARWAGRLGATGLPLLTLALLAHALRARLADWRERWLVAGTGVAVWVALSSEVLGSIRRLDRAGVIAAWLVAVVLAAWAAVAAARRSGATERRPRPSLTLAGFADASLGACCLTILALLLLVAVLSTPNSNDGLAYHLPRVARWIAHRSLEPFRSFDVRQVEYAPFGELAILHAMLLWTTDRFAQAIQWLAMVATALAVGACAARLGASRTGQWAAVLFWISVPIAALQATSTQNELVLTGWIAVMGWAILVVRSQRRAGGRGVTAWLWMAGIAAGLAVHTKGTAFFYLPLLLAWAWIEASAPTRTGALGREPWRLTARRASRAAVALVLPMVLLCGAHWLRNQRLFGSPLISDDMDDMARDPASVASILLRDLSAHVSVLGVSPEGRDRVVRIVRRLHAAAGVDPDDPRTTFPSKARYEIFSNSPLYETAAGAGWHLALVSILMAGWAATVLFAGRRSKTPSAGARWLAVAAGGGILLLAIGSPWQIWVARLHLPALALLAPVAGVLADRLLPRPAVIALALALAASAIPPTVSNQARPLVGPHSILRTDPTAQMFALLPSLRQPMVAFAARLERSSCRQVARVGNPRHQLEYPLWRLLNGPARTSHRFRIEDVGVENYTRSLPSLDPAPFEPCAAVRIFGASFEVLRAPWLAAEGEQE